MNPAVTGPSPCFSQKLFRAFAKVDETEGSHLSIFFRHCASKTERGDPSVSSAFANARKSFWLKQGLGPSFATFFKKIYIYSLRYIAPTLDVPVLFVGAFSLKEKSSTITVASFFFFFSSNHRPHRVCTTF